MNAVHDARMSRRGSTPSHKRVLGLQVAFGVSIQEVQSSSEMQCVMCCVCGKTNKGAGGRADEWVGKWVSG